MRKLRPPAPPTSRPSWKTSGPHATDVGTPSSSTPRSCRQSPFLKFAFAGREGTGRRGPMGSPTNSLQVVQGEKLRMFGPVVLKTILRVEAPLQWIGGLLHELYKGSGVASAMQNWRQILCSNSGGKRLHAIVRPGVFAFADTWLSDTQCGGRPGQGIDFSSHIVKSFIDLLFFRRSSGFLLFVIISCAIYSAIRPLFRDGR